MFSISNVIGAALPCIGFALGTWLDRKETERMSLFRDKSALYGGRQRKDSTGKPIPSWP